MQLRHHRGRMPTRRAMIRTAAAVSVAAGVGPFVHVSPARAAKTLKILQWKHFVPGYDTWFNDTYVKTWGAQHDTRVIVDNIGLADLNDHAEVENLGLPFGDLLHRSILASPGDPR